jgi:hypothetical protein
MNRVSLKSGTPRMTHGSSVSSVAAMMGSAAFLLPLMVTSPCNGTPPLIRKLSMIYFSFILIVILVLILNLIYEDDDEDEDDFATRILSR